LNVIAPPGQLTFGSHRSALELADESLTMDGMNKRTLKRQYRESEIPVGIYRVVNTQANRSLVGSSVNLPAILNRHRADLKMGAHRNQELQRDWNQLGEGAFTFEILDTLSPRAEPGYDVKRELATLEELWLERLAPYGERGYNTRPK
jgi:hypothetical protein